MELVAQNAHVDDLNAATTSAYFVFTATLGFMQLHVDLVAAFTQAESTPSCIPEQVPLSHVVQPGNTYSSQFLCFC